MIEPAAPPADSYSPQFRTALVLTGTGTAGAYHAGVLRALHEAGVKLDIVAGSGIGVVGALFAAVDGAQRLWDEKGFWRSPAVRSLYNWRMVPRAVAWAAAFSAAVVALPLAAAALGLVVFPIDFALKMVGAESSGLVDAYLALVRSMLAPDALPTWLPRVVILVLAVAAVAVCVHGLSRRPGRRRRGPFWWRLVPAPLSPAEAEAHCWRTLWDLVRGAAQLKQPSLRDLGRRYTDLLKDNLGQPGFRELLITAHDLDAQRDLVFALVEDSRRRDLVRRATTQAALERQAEVFDLSGVAADHIVAAIGGSLSVPLVTEPHPITFATEGYWRGETHRLCERPGGVARLLQELADLGVQQAIVASASPESIGPHALSAPRLDGRGRIGEFLQSVEAAAVRDALRSAAPGMPRLFMVRPDHNPIGPFDFAGGFDDRSDRRRSLGELLNRGYEDAYRQFVEPVVGASGDRVGSPDAGVRGLSRT